MSFQPGANLYTQGFGSRPENVEVPHYDNRIPSSSDILYPIGKEWIYIGNSIWKLLSLSTSQGVTSATWVEIADSDGPVQEILGTANQIDVANSAGTYTLSLASDLIAPGSVTATTFVEATTSMTAGTDITATAGDIVADAGNIESTLGSVTAGTTVTAGTGISSTTGDIVADAGDIEATLGSVSAGASVTAGTTVTATLGDITATNGNLVLGTAGNKLSIATGANASVGSSTLTNGTVTVSTTAVTASSVILLTRQSIGTTGANDLGILSVGTVTPATSFVINALTVTDATSLQADDQSVIGWMIVN